MPPTGLAFIQIRIRENNFEKKVPALLNSKHNIGFFSVLNSERRPGQKSYMDKY